MAEEVLNDAPVSLPESTTYEEYVAQRMEAAHRDDLAAVLEPDAVADESPDSGQDPEVTESAPVEELKPAAETPPEPVPESGTGKETQEQQEQREKNKGIPQERLDEVTKARREAERERDAERAEKDRLARELAELKAKPAETPKPADEPVTQAEPEKPKPVAPDTPALEDFDADWDKYQAALKKYNKETYPAYVEELADWKADQRENATKKKADEAAAATRKQAEDAAQKTAREAEIEADNSWKSQIQAAKDSHPDFLEKVNAAPASAAMVQAIQDMDGGAEFAYWLAGQPEEAKRITALTGADKPMAGPQFRKAVAKAHLEFSKLDTKIPPAAAPAAEPAKPAAEVPVVSALPVNPKPNSTKAPRPPNPVTERGAQGVKNPKAAQTLEEYEEARRAQQPTRR